MAKWGYFTTNALEAFNPINSIEDYSKRQEAKRRRRFQMFKTTHALQKQILIKPKYVEAVAKTTI